MPLKTKWIALIYFGIVLYIVFPIISLVTALEIAQLTGIGKEGPPYIILGVNIEGLLNAMCTMIWFAPFTVMTGLPVLASFTLAIIVLGLRAYLKARRP